jgi:hypothetical protein
MKLVELAKGPWWSWFYMVIFILYFVVSCFEQYILIIFCTVWITLWNYEITIKILRKKLSDSEKALRAGACVSPERHLDKT